MTMHFSTTEGRKLCRPSSYWTTGELRTKDADAVSCGECRKMIVEREARREFSARMANAARGPRLAPLPSDLPREAAEAAGFLLLLVARGSLATEAECAVTDRALDALRADFPEAARALEDWHFQNA
jgi:hypothetical protein